MYVQLTIGETLVLVVALFYAVFDVFNKRNVPDLFVYASIALGVAATLVLSTSEAAMIASFAIAIAIWIIGYLIYREGLWGAGDYFELVAISLLLPIQPAPLLSTIPQFSLPFILSVFVATGFVAVWIVPLYYLFFTRRGHGSIRLSRRRAAYGITLLVLYLLLALAMLYFYGSGISKLVFVAAIAIPSALTLAFEEEITDRMVERIYPRGLEEGDIIAFNVMSGAERRYFRTRYRAFGRLATNRLIERIRNIRRKLPVYRNAAPLAFFIFIGVVVSLLLGNIILPILYQ